MITPCTFGLICNHSRVGAGAMGFPLPISAKRLCMCLYFSLLPINVFTDCVSYPCHGHQNLEKNLFPLNKRQCISTYLGRRNWAQIIIHAITWLNFWNYPETDLMVLDFLPIIRFLWPCTTSLACSVESKNYSPSHELYQYYVTCCY